jgi:hypothetical protein
MPEEVLPGSIWAGASMRRLSCSIKKIQTGTFQAKVDAGNSIRRWPRQTKNNSTGAVLHAQKCITNRWSCRLKWSSVSYGCRCYGSLRAGDSAAQLNSSLYPIWGDVLVAEPAWTFLECGVYTKKKRPDMAFSKKQVDVSMRGLSKRRQN